LAGQRVGHAAAKNARQVQVSLKALLRKAQKVRAPLRSEVKHPQLGSGLLVTIQIRGPAAFEEIAKSSGLLNFLEANDWTDFPQLGCWQAHNIDGSEQQFGLAHASFVPNALYSPGLATNFAIWSVARARWLRQKIGPKLKDKPMGEIIAKRFFQI
jgi:hypothetical protein